MQDETVGGYAMDVVSYEGNALIDEYVARLRDMETTRAAYRQASRDLATLMLPGMADAFSTYDDTVTTPVDEAAVHRVDVDDLVVVGVARAGQTTAEAVGDVFGDVDIGFVDAWRDEESNVTVNWKKLPDVDDRTVLISDPMIATGNTMEAVHETVEEHGDPARYVVQGFIATEKGLCTMDETYPDDTAVYVAGIDPALDEHDYIVPGLGDAGDRTYAEPDL